MNPLKLILPLFLFVSSSYSQVNQFKTDRYLQVIHSPGIETFSLYKLGKIKLETYNDTPYSYSNDIVFNEGWSKYYNFDTKKFTLSNQGNRSYTVETNWIFDTNTVSDGQYSRWIVNSHDQKVTSEFVIDTYRGIVDLPPTGISNRNSTIYLVFDKLRNKKYIFVEYDKLTYIYGTN